MVDSSVGGMQWYLWPRYVWYRTLCVPFVTSCTVISGKRSYVWAALYIRRPAASVYVYPVSK